MAGKAAADVRPPPDAVIVNRRWVPLHLVQWAENADRIMLEHGTVFGTVVQERHQAHWKAKKLTRLMVDLGLHDRWELRYHTDRRDGGWMWSVEYLCRNGRHGDG